MTLWHFSNPVSIRFGRGCRRELVESLSNITCLLITSKRGANRLKVDPLLKEWFSNSRNMIVDTVETNPGIEYLEALTNALLSKKFGAIVAIGGGSVVDTAKVLSLGLSDRCGTSSVRSLIAMTPSMAPQWGVPLYVAPTTRGSGSEVTQYATVWDHINKRKLSLSGEAVFAKFAIVDPDLSDHLPRETMISSGLDAVNQAAESLWNKNSSIVSEALALKAIRLGVEALPQLIQRSRDKRFGDNMAAAATLSGLAISQTRTALCHSISYPLTSYFGIPHGIACAFTMPAVLSHSLLFDDGRFSRLASALGLPEQNYGAALISTFANLNRQLGVANFVREAAGSLDVILSLSKEMLTPGRADNALHQVDDKLIRDILVRSWSET